MVYVMKYIIVALLALSVFGLMIPNVFAENVPDWVKNTAGWWATDAISETEFVNAISYLAEVGIIQLASLNQEINSCEFEHIPVLNNLNPQQKIDVCKSAQIDYLSECLDCTNCSPDIKYNSYGFRGPEISKEKPDNTIRIFLVGGSTLANAEYADEFFSIESGMSNNFFTCSRPSGLLEIISMISFTSKSKLPFATTFILLNFARRFLFG